jgi:predicted regulator of Ras-like GTPase activity (Roadblock/LC7/MglB family)
MIFDITGLVIHEHDLGILEGALDSMLLRSLAQSVLLVNRDDGSLIAARGALQTLDTLSLAALAAGAFASSGEIARLVGEPEFSVLFHEGRREHIHVNLAGDHGLLMTIFDDATTVGLVRLCAREASAQIARVLAGQSDLQREAAPR